MSDPVSYERRDGVALITMDDGKANAISPRMQAALHRALDRVRREDAAAVVLTGRSDIFSGGFDLKILKAGGLEALGMVRGGFKLAARLLTFPRPVVIACHGHAIAMGVFLLLSGDYRVGAAGGYTMRANEVAIGLTLPRAAVAICRQRLAPAHFVRATLLSEACSPAEAVAAGFLDRVVEPEAVLDVCLDYAAGVTELDLPAHARTKKRIHKQTLRAIRWGLRADTCELLVQGIRALVGKRARPTPTG